MADMAPWCRHTTNGLIRGARVMGSVAPTTWHATLEGEFTSSPVQLQYIVCVCKGERCRGVDSRESHPLPLDRATDK